MEDWEKNPNKYLTDAQGNYILKKDGTPQKKRGRPKNSELSDVRAALHAQKALKKKNSKVTKLRRSLKKAEKEKTAYQMRFLKFLGKSLSSIEGDIRKFTNEKNRLEKAFPNLEKEISKLSNELKDKDVQDAREKVSFLVQKSMILTKR